MVGIIVKSMVDALV